MPNPSSNDARETPATRQLTLRVDGMHCADEVGSIRQELGSIRGVGELQFDVLNSKLVASFDPAVVNPDQIAVSIRKLGMGAEPWSERPTSAVRGPDGTLISAIVSAAMLAAAVAVHAGQQGWSAVFGSSGDVAPPLLAILAYVAATAAGAWYIAPKALRSALRFRADMNVLMTIAVTGAIAIGEYIEAATVSFLFALSLALEAWSVGRARRAVAALMALSPPRATIRTAAGGEQTVDAGAVPIGSTVIVRPGEKFPLDGRVTHGETSVNQAPITGESRPVPKAVGDEVFAGTINEDGAIEFVSTKAAGDTTLARIAKLVGEAQARRAPSEQWVETFARYYTPIVMVLAILVGMVPPLLMGRPWADWIYQALVLLVIACPCALVISTPVSIVAAIASAARNGVLIKGGPFVEAPAGLRAVALDKTGTLTEGRPEVREIVPLAGHDERELLEMASAIEQRSEHPLARAIVRHAQARNLNPAPVDNYQAIKGKGATAQLGTRSVWIGSHRLLEERAQETPEMHARLEALSAAGSSIVVIGEGDHVCGFIALADRVRDSSPATIRDLRSAGIEHVIMLTGDNAGTAQAVGRTTGIDEVRAELLPEQKVTAIEELVARYERVAMIGDGVNDAPALARSTLGIAMGVAGSDAALETADVALMSDDLSKVPWLIRHSRHALAIIRQNIVASLVVKGLFILLTFLGKASLWAAIAADTGMSLVVVLNALRLLRGGKP